MECVKADIKNKKTIMTNVAIPKIEKDEDVIIEIVYAGICGTDLHIIQGEFEAQDHVTLGHEIVGKIFDISASYTDLKKGDRVTINPNRSCGICTPCRRKKYNFCIHGGLNNTVGIFKDGGWAKYCKVHISLVYKLPDSLSFDQAIVCEPLSCIIHGLDSLQDVDIGSNILIIGAGIIGILWSCTLHHLGHRKVIVSEPNEGRRNILNNLGLGFKCSSWNEILEFRKQNQSYAVDLCIDCSGNVDAVQAIPPLLNNGAVFLIFGVAPPESCISLHPYELFRKEITVMGVNISTPTSFEKTLSIMEAMSDRYLDPEKMKMKFFNLQDHEKALETFLSGKYTKIIYKM